MFSVMCACQSVCSQWATHVNITHGAFDLTMEGLPRPSSVQEPPSLFRDPLGPNHPW